MYIFKNSYNFFRIRDNKLKQNSIKFKLFLDLFSHTVILQDAHRQVQYTSKFEGQYSRQLPEHFTIGRGDGFTSFFSSLRDAGFV